MTAGGRIAATAAARAAIAFAKTVLSPILRWERDLRRIRASREAVASNREMMTEIEGGKRRDVKSESLFGEEDRSYTRWAL